MTDVDQDRLNMAHIAGADKYVLTDEAKLDDIKRKHTDNDGFDIVLTACPALEAQQMAFRYVKKRGTINFFGGLPASAGNLSLPSNIIHYNEIKVLGSHGSTPRHHDLAVALITSGKIKVSDLITQTIPLEQLPQQFEELSRNRKNLKVVVRPNSP
jgi:L-iditol 2-dehydrogenase